MVFNSRTKNILQTLFIFVFILKLSYAEKQINEMNTYTKHKLQEDEERIILKIDEPKEQIMAIDFIFSNPSKYESITFNRYDVENDQEEQKETEKEPETEGESTEKEVDPTEDEKKETETTEKESTEKEVDPTGGEKNETETKQEGNWEDDGGEEVDPTSRRLSTIYTENQTDLVIEGKEVNGKKVVYLKLDKETKAIAFTIYKDKSKSVSDTDYIYLRYRVAEEKPEFYSLSKKDVTTAVEKDIVNITFSGISQFKDVKNGDDFSVKYIIRFVDKETASKNFEQPISYFLDSTVKPLSELTLNLAGVSAGENIEVRLQGTLNEKKPQLALVFAKATFKGETEHILYNPVEFTITEAEEKKDNTEKKEEKTDENKDKVEENKMKFFVILGCFIGIVVIVFIIIMIYIAMKPKVENPEDSGDYKNVGAIRNVNEEEN